jgi:uncharacterized membrane protein
MTEEQPIIDNDKLFAALAYIFWPLAVFILVSEANKGRLFQRYHAVQSLGLDVVIAVAYAFLACFYGIIFAIAKAIADLLGTLLSCLAAPLWFIPAALLVWCAYRAYKGEKFEIPVLTEFMQGQGWL